jgi:hypothetical protein
VSPGLRAFCTEVIESAKSSALVCLVLILIFLFPAFLGTYLDAKDDSKIRQEHDQLVAKQRDLMHFKEHGHRKQVKVSSRSARRVGANIHVHYSYGEGAIWGEVAYDVPLPPGLTVPLPNLPIAEESDDPLFSARARQRSIDDMVRQLSVLRNDERVEVVYLPDSLPDHLFASQLDDKLQKANEDVARIEESMRYRQTQFRNAMLLLGKVILLIGWIPFVWTLLAGLTRVVRPRTPPHSELYDHATWNTVINECRGVSGQEERLAAGRLGRLIATTSDPGQLATELSNKERVRNSHIVSSIVPPLWATAFMVSELGHSWTGLTEFQQDSLVNDVMKCIEALRSHSGSGKPSTALADLVDRFVQKAISAKFPETSLSKLRELQQSLPKSGQDRHSMDSVDWNEMLRRERNNALLFLSRCVDFQPAVARR